MKDPVISVDGYTYERAAIEQYFETHGAVSPFMKTRLSTKAVIPNRNLKCQIHLRCAYNDDSMVFFIFTC